MVAQSRLPKCPFDQTVLLWTNCQGNYTFPNGEKYVGEYRDGKSNGKGIHTLPNGLGYVGEFKDGNANGQGTLTSSDGWRCAGEFRDDKMNGLGTATFPKRTVRQFVGLA